MPLPPDYQARLSELHASLVHARTVQTGTLIMLAATVALFSLLVWLAFQRRVPAWSTLLPVPLAAAAGRRYIRNRSGWLRTSRLERTPGSGSRTRHAARVARRDRAAGQIRFQGFVQRDVRGLVGERDLPNLVADTMAGCRKLAGPWTSDPLYVCGAACRLAFMDRGRSVDGGTGSR